MEKVSSNDIRNLSEIYSSIHNHQEVLNEQDPRSYGAQHSEILKNVFATTLAQPFIQYQRGAVGEKPPTGTGRGETGFSSFMYRSGKTSKEGRDRLFQYLKGVGLGKDETKQDLCPGDKPGTLKTCSFEPYGDLISEHLQIIFGFDIVERVTVTKSGGKLGYIELGPDGKPKPGAKFQELNQKSDPEGYKKALERYNTFLTPKNQSKYEKALADVRTKQEKAAAEKAAAEKAAAEKAAAEKAAAEKAAADQRQGDQRQAEAPPAEEPKTVLAKQEGETGVVKVSGGQPVKGSFEKKDWSATEKQRYETLRGAEQLKKDVETVAKIKKDREQQAQQTQPENPKTTRESYDSFDNISDFLMCGGYAQNLNEATSIMVNMDDQWKNYILELFE